MIPAIQGDRRMTVREVAEALGVDRSTVTRWIERLFPSAVANGQTTYLDEVMVTAIKQAIGTGRNDLCNIAQVRNVTTSLEIEEMTLKVIAYHKAQADRLRAELALAAPRLAAADALMASPATMSITNAAKHFGRHPKAEVFPYLRAAGYLTRDDLPTQDAIDAGYLVLREARCPDGTVRKQAMVLVSQLDTWRVRVIPQIDRWLKKEA